MDRRTLLVGIFTIILYSLALNLPFLWEREFQGEAARRVVAALEMMERGDYLIPYIEGRPYLLKPPGYNWVLIVFFKLFGSHTEFVARLSSVTAATLAALFLALLFRAVARPPGLLWILPGLVFLSTPEVLDKACRAEIDMTYTLLVTVSVFSWFYFHEIRRRPFWAWSVGLGVAALATLTKTFQAVIFFYTPIFPYLLWKKRLREFFSLPHLAGLGIYALIFLAWFLPASREVGSRTILRAWLGEYLSKKNPLEPSGFWGHALSFPLAYLQGHLPWILFVLGYFSREFRKSLSVPLRNLALFSVLFVGLSFPLYWLSPGARLRYLLPTVGALTFLISAVLEYSAKTSKIPQVILWPLKILVIVLVLLGPVFAVSAWNKLRLYENEGGLFFLGLLSLGGIGWSLLRDPRQKIWGLFVFVFLAKLAFSAVYFPYQDRFRDHYRRAARLLQKYLSRGSLLCDYGVNTPHLTYYLGYTSSPPIRIRMVSPNELNKCKMVITPQGITLQGFKPLLNFKARRRPLTLWKKT
ncbi:hypothetical protein FVE67_05450 [Thermosulfurimonas marina]|uniref:Glycosyltransferase RgtA/B/C/D-like domain-containing protein n=1 Tax=Thermosulfurimonas marina TaxID=2047767 RepID=A0A6H1WSV7_9BACT|nr:glycosyltransferase family 39 protein [Thermosulfurimonas marina]QJA06283.1 hypothetical protein FVE67_05450 [Thermosulfurimonas marina]